MTIPNSESKPWGITAHQEVFKIDRAPEPVPAAKIMEQNVRILAIPSTDATKVGFIKSFPTKVGDYHKNSKKEVKPLFLLMSLMRLRRLFETICIEDRKEYQAKQPIKNNCL